MKLLIVLFILSVSTANAGIYKCKDSKGKTSYQNNPCKALSETQNTKIYRDKQPTVSMDEIVMRAKNDVAMRRIINEHKAKEQALLDRQNRISRNIATNKKIKEANFKHYKERADNWKETKEDMITRWGKNAAQRRIDKYEDKTREYK